MPTGPRHLFPALFAVLVALLIGAPIVSANATHGARASSVARTGVGDGRALNQAGQCAKHATPARSRHARPALRKREARRLRSCRRRLASQSTAPAAPIYWGAWIGEQLTGTQAPWDMGAVSKFEQMTGKPMSLVHFSSPFADCSSSPCSFYKFPAEEMTDIRGHGSIPFFSWASQSTPASVNEPEFQLADVIAGRYDSYIREFAEGARAWGHPFFLRFNWEMNGNWFEWSEGVNGNQPGEYVTAWRHVHDIFREVGATNATWVWCPNIDPGARMQNLASLYPGDEYVDWTGLDGYNAGTNPQKPEGWRTFDQLYASTYRTISEEIAPSKPLAVSEIGSTEDGGSKAAWIENALSSIPAKYPKVGALLWFEKYDDGMDWPIETSTSATSAFASGIQNPAYRGNSYGDIAASPIPVAQ